MSRAVSVALILGLAAACGEPEPVASRVDEIRPTEPNAYVNIRYDGPSDSIASDGGEFRVHWATEGKHAPNMGDTMPANGVPDFVDETAAVADRVFDFLQADGWRTALTDEALAVNGGDGKYDIYVVNFEGSSDGLVATNACYATDNTCITHLLIAHNFAGRGYASDSEGINVLVSHEYFHAVQYAYHADLPQWWSEGTATWFEEYFDPSQGDFERLVRRYFVDADRALDSRIDGFADGWAYRTAVFPRFLELSYGAGVIRRTFERLAEGDELFDALETSLAEIDTTLGEAFATFAAWNAFTGSRATSSGYPSAAQFEEVPLTELDASRATNWQIATDALAAKYARVALSGNARIRVEPRDGYLQPTVFIATAPDQYTVLGDEWVETTESSVLIAVAGSSIGGRNAATVQVRNIAPAIEEEEETPDDDVDEEQEETHDNVLTDDESGCSSAAGDPSLLPLVGVVLLGFDRTRRRRLR